MVTSSPANSQTNKPNAPNQWKCEIFCNHGLEHWIPWERNLLIMISSELCATCNVSQSCKGACHLNLPCNCVGCRSRILQNLKIKTLVERGLALAVEVYILRGETLNWIPELQLCQIPTQTFYLNWNCWEQSFHNAKRNFHIFKQNLKWQPFPQDICCNFVSKCSVNTKEPFWKRHNNSFYASEKRNWKYIEFVPCPNANTNLAFHAHFSQIPLGQRLKMILWGSNWKLNKSCYSSWCLWQ